MKVLTSDLIRMAQNGKFDVIVHGCNCFCAMGSGIAPVIAKTFPDALEVDKNTIKGDKQKLGTISVAYDQDYELYVVNAYTQFSFGGKEVHVDYDAIRTCFKQIKTEFHDLRIGIPMIGAGLGGGDWDIISGIIDEVFGPDVDCTLVKWEQS